MPTDPELRQGVSTWAKKLKNDPNRPYRVRRRKPGAKDSRGQSNTIDQYEYRSMDNIRTQPLSDQELSRLPEGMRGTSWRFIMVVPNNPGQLPAAQDEFLDFGDQIEYKNHWYEIKMINDWDLNQGCKAVFVE